MKINVALVASLVSRNVKPAFEHDCSACVFLGTLDGCDLYTCPRDSVAIYRFGVDGAYGCAPIDAACKGEPGTPYSLILTLAARRRADVRRFTPNAYRTADGRFTPKHSRTCGGCEDCDAEDTCDAERIALSRAEARIQIDDYSCSIG